MKKNLKIAALVMVQVMLISMFGMAQTQTTPTKQTSKTAQTITGTQTAATTAKTADLQCTPVTFTNAVKVTEVTGTNEGFYIKMDGYTTPIYTFTASNDPKAIGVVLKPGKYWVYPNLQKNAKEATVVVTLDNL